MVKGFAIPFYAALFAVAGSLASCNESRRGNDSNVDENRNEAAEEANEDRYAGQLERDAEFVYETVASNYAEIKLAELANQRSRNDEVNKVAARLIADHTNAVNELKRVAQAKAIEIPVEETDAGERKIERLRDESADEFAREWTDTMLELHENDIEEFEKMLEDTEDAEIKTFIQSTLPKLKEHREELEALKKSLEEER